MIASLPMYDRPETAAASDMLWAAIRDNLGFGPAHLTRGTDGLNHWLSPDLLLSQTCGMPYRLHLHGNVQLIGTPVWALQDVPAGYYYSVIICRPDSGIKAFQDCAGKRFACNMKISQSGWAAAETEALEHGFSFKEVVETGAHLASANAVAENRAEVAAIDVVTWALIRRHDPILVDRLNVIHKTPPTPALPYITSRGQDAGDIYRAMDAAIQTLPKTIRDLLCLSGITSVPAEAYLAVPSPAFPRVTRH